MIDLNKEWSISFAGCGFMGIYYVGATSCILERFPRFIQDASRIYGASAGSLMATVLTVGIPIEKCCADLMSMAKEARKHKLGPLHPAFNLLQIVKDSMEASLPEDAHVRASEKLCVSLTRVSDRKNVLVSQFDSRDELIEALICSCFVPFYCGVIPPTYRGVRYVDGAVSDNLPRCHLKHTITVSAYAGESDLCPPTSSLNFHEVRFNNVSIQVNSENMYRVTSTFFPPEPQKVTTAKHSKTREAMAEICHNGYVDALRFLQENNLISSECPMRSLEIDAPKPACCKLARESDEEEESSESTPKNELTPPEDEHRWLDPQLIENLPVNLKKALCEACRETPSAGGLLSHMTGYLPKIPHLRPVESARSLAQRLVNWVPDVPTNMSWLYGLAGGIYNQAGKSEAEEYDRETPLRRSTSLPSDLDLWNHNEGDINALPLTPEATPTSSLNFTWDTHSAIDYKSLTPPSTPTLSTTAGFGEAAAESPEGAGSGWGLGRAVGWIRNIASERTSNYIKTEASKSSAASSSK